jgi:hypothetical protein
MITNPYEVKPGDYLIHKKTKSVYRVVSKDSDICYYTQNLKTRYSCYIFIHNIRLYDIVKEGIVEELFG